MTGRRRGIPWLVLGATILLGAGVQALTATPGFGRMPVWLFALAAAASVVALWLELAAVAWGVAAVAAHRRLGAFPGRLLLWAGLAFAAAALIAVLVPWALPLVAVAALCVLPAVAAGRRALSGFAVFRHTPWRAVIAVIVALIAVAVGWVVALLAGFFLTGAFGGFAMWVWFGMLGTALLLWWARLGERVALSARETPAEARDPDPTARSTRVG